MDYFEPVNEEGVVTLRLIIRLIIVFVCAANITQGLSVMSLQRSKSKAPATDMLRQAMMNQGSSDLIMLSSGFSTMASPSSISTKGDLVIETKDVSDLFIIPEIFGVPVVFPSPFNQRDGAALYYNLSKDMTIKLYVYNMFSDLVYQLDCSAGSGGGLKGENRIGFDIETLYGNVLSSGAYFWYIVHEGRILGRGKMAIIP